MGDKATEFSFEQYCEVIKEFAPCMDDYLYFYDISKDLYYISEHALKRFAIPGNMFSNVTETHKKFVYEDDVDMLVEDLQKMVSGEKDEHNIEYRWVGLKREPIWINCRGRSIKDENGKPMYMVGCVNEIGTRQKADNVSGLKESLSIANTLDAFCRQAKSGYVLHIGIDDFKAVNERFGHEYGDFIIKGVAECIVQSLMPGEEVYRVVADEFIVIDYLGSSVEEGKELYDRIRNKVDDFIEFNRYETVFTISGGVISCQDMQAVSYHEMIKLSQFALSQAKHNGKNRVYFFSEEDYLGFLRKGEILSYIREAIAASYEGFEVYYQPIMKDGDGRELYAAEALLRYTMPTGERVSPMEFVPILEESGLIIPVGKWVLGQAMAFSKKMQAKYPDFKVSVNVSYVQVIKSPFIVDFFRMLKEYGLSPAGVVVELTESGELEDSPQIKKVWDNLREFGVTIALDDFGTGYSNLMNISDMKPNVVKLDRGFTVKALTNDFERQLMSNTIQLVHSLGLKICVEGVETEEDLRKIHALRPDYIQGYFYGKPCPKKEFIERY